MSDRRRSVRPSDTPPQGQRRVRLPRSATIRAGLSAATVADTISISNEALKRQQHNLAAPNAAVADAPYLTEDPRLRAMRLILEALTGEKIEMRKVLAHLYTSTTIHPLCAVKLWNLTLL